MVPAPPSVTLPAKGYGDEPKSEADVLLTAAARVRATLPAGWTVRTQTRLGELGVTTNTHRRPDSRLSLTREGMTVATYVVEARRVLGSSSLQPAIIHLLDHQRATPHEATRTRPMLVARYLNPQQQRALRERGIAYADATGNFHLTSDDPLILLSDRGATADPWRGPGRPPTGLKGLPAAKLVRALADFIQPYSVTELADLAGTSLGATYRLIHYLAGEGLLTRADRGPITGVDWPEILRRWSLDARYLDTSTMHGFLEPRGLDSLVAKFGYQTPTQRYAVSGSLATQPYAPYAEARLGLVYCEDPMTLASGLDLRPVDTGANVLLVAPRSPVVFERTSTWRGITIVAPSQAAADLLGGPGRNPAEGTHLLDWMKENEDAWRRQPDR